MVGMAKPVDADRSAFLLDVGVSCGEWVPTPAEVVESVSFLTTVRCQDHEHPLVRVVFADPDPGNKVAVALAELLRRTLRGHRPQEVGATVAGVEPDPGDRDTPCPCTSCYNFLCADGRGYQSIAGTRFGCCDTSDWFARNNGYRYCNERVTHYAPCPRG
jgi:hypothetical protein